VANRRSDHRLQPSERPGPGNDETSAWQRVKPVGVAIVNIAIAFSATRFAMGRGHQSSQQNARLSARMMQSGWGKIVCCGGPRAGRGRWLSRLQARVEEVSQGPASLRRHGDHRGRRRRLRGEGRGTGRCGHTRHHRVIIATLQADPSKATGFDAAIKTLGHAPFGKVLLVLAALGCAAFGTYSFVRSRHGRM